MHKLNLNSDADPCISANANEKCQNEKEKVFSQVELGATVNDESQKLKELPSNNIEVKQGKKINVLFKEILVWSLKYFVSLFLGFFFGYAMEKAKVYEPRAIRQQMIFRRFIMLKMFLSAFGTSMLSILLVALIFKKR